MIQEPTRADIRVLVVDDSPVIQKLLSHILNSTPGIQVIGTASNGLEAVEAVNNKTPDVITMDYHMPKMNGLTATRNILKTHAVPIIIVSSTLFQSDTTDAFHVLESGAVALIATPVGPEHPEYHQMAKALIQTVKSMSEIKVVRRRIKQSRSPLPVSIPNKIRSIQKTIKLIAIGASTGGPIVLKTILSILPKNFPIPILIVQHIAAGFTQGLVEWLKETSGYDVQIAMSGEHLTPQKAYIAPDGFHLQINHHGFITLNNHPPMNGHRPSVSMLFRSVSEIFGAHAIGVLLTGMGIDGALELKLMKDQGALTIAQNKETSVVFGMPGEAIELNGASLILSPQEIGMTLSKLGGIPYD